jgi:type II secretory pathway pseudopilin PulG
MKFKKILAFTLAEVLITMTIVGAIAAMTIPTLLNKRVQTERSAKLRKFYSRMTNAIDLMGMNGQSFKYMNAPSSSSAIYDWYIANVDRYMGHKYLDNRRIYFADGSFLSFNSATDCNMISEGSGGGANDKCIYSLYDTNGMKLPNIYGADRYVFLFCFSPTVRQKYLGNSDTFFGAFSKSVSSTTTDVQMRALCNNSGNNCRAVCTKWLQINNWEYPENYPFK